MEQDQEPFDHGGAEFGTAWRSLTLTAVLMMVLAAILLAASVLLLIYG